MNIEKKLEALVGVEECLDLLCERCGHLGRKHAFPLHNHNVILHCLEKLTPTVGPENAKTPCSCLRFVKPKLAGS